MKRQFKYLSFLLSFAMMITMVPAFSVKKAVAEEAQVVEVNEDEIVGNLKIIARYNDSMPFYDGHAYLAFTSYQDDVEIKVDDLYGCYEISDQYYRDIKNDISVGSHRTGTNSSKYFTFKEGENTVVLDRGEIVTIGQYRGFDYTVPKAVLDTLMSSTAWNEVTSAGKEEVVKMIFSLLSGGEISVEGAITRLTSLASEIGTDYTKWLDGVLEGGVCFNRELYNQKLEWDQFENVTYEMDITRAQLNRMMLYLGGNLNKFSLLKNSCATVVARAWNAVVGADSEYAISPTGKGLFALFDAPKTIRDEIVNKLPGYYLNNSEGVQEPNAGYYDEDAEEWVYVTAPEVISPVEFIYDDDSVIIDEEKSNLSDVLRVAMGDNTYSFSKEVATVGAVVSIPSTGESTTIDGIYLSVNGIDGSIDADSYPENAIWLESKIPDYESGSEYYVVDGDGKPLPSAVDGDSISFRVDSLPISYKIVKSSEGAYNYISTQINDAEESHTTEVYYKSGDDKVLITDETPVLSGTKVYVKATPNSVDSEYFLDGIDLNGDEILSYGNYDSAEKAYCFKMPSTYSNLTISYDYAYVFAKSTSVIQMSVSDEAKVSDYVEAIIGKDSDKQDKIEWRYVDTDAEDGCFEISDDHRSLKATKAGTANVWACIETNENIGVLFKVEVYENMDDMVNVTVNSDNLDYVSISYVDGDDEVAFPYSTYKVKKGSEIKITPVQYDSVVLSEIKKNDTEVLKGEKIVADEDTEITVSFEEAVIKGVPSHITLDKKGDTYQFDGAVKYKALKLNDKEVYDSEITYKSADESLVKVDETGLVTVVGDIPEEGAIVYVSAIAGSSNGMVLKQCRVTLGDYAGSKIVGKLTLASEPFFGSSTMSHSTIGFTTYEDINMDVNYYKYYKPDQVYKDLLQDYLDNEKNYESNPVFYKASKDYTNRDSYIDTILGDSKASNIELKAGESISFSNAPEYGAKEVILSTFINGQIFSEESAATVISEISKYMFGMEPDYSKTFDSVLDLLKKIILTTYVTGYNPADGIVQGGITVNKDVYDTFNIENYKLNNVYYEIEITADELALLKSYLSNSENNYYSFFNYNSAGMASNIWNSVLADRPEYAVNSNYTKLGSEPMSLYASILALIGQSELEGKGGVGYWTKVVGGMPEPEETAEPESTVPATMEATEMPESSEGPEDSAEPVVSEEPGDINPEVSSEPGDSADKQGDNSDAKDSALVNKADGDAAQSDDLLEAVKRDTKAEIDKLKVSYINVINSMTGLSDSKKASMIAELTNLVENYKKAIDSKTSVSDVYATLDLGTNAVELFKTDAANSNEVYVKSNNKYAINKDCKIKVTEDGAAKLKWGKVPNADGYKIYLSKVGDGNVFRKVISKVITGSTVSIKLRKITGVKLDPAKNYCFAVKAYKEVDDEEECFVKSKVYYAAGAKSEDASNAKKVKVNKKSVTLNVGEASKIKAKSKLADDDKELIKEAKTIYYFSSDKNVAKVTSKGKIKALEKGECTVVCKAANGKKKMVEVVVE